MSTTSRKFMDLQEGVYTKLESLGASREIVYKFEELLNKTDSFEFYEFAEKMAGYAMTIFILSETTEYQAEDLWDIWEGLVSTFVEGESASETLEEEWKGFVDVTNEKDW